MRAASCSLMLLASVGCSSERHVAIDVAAFVGGQPFSCTQTYAGIGTSKTTLTPLDLKMYVHDVALVQTDGVRVPLVLDEDDTWQHDGVALLDFEDGTGTCATDSPATNMRIVGRLPDGRYDGVALTLGVPAARDHLDVVTATAPLDDPGMFWSWLGGYKYLKLDVVTTKNPTWFFHLAAQSCSGVAATGIECAYPNLATIALDHFVPGSSKVVLDLGTLLADSDLDAPSEVGGDSVVGCMSSTDDPDCPPLFAKLGMGFEGSAAPAPQSAFELR